MMWHYMGILLSWYIIGIIHIHMFKIHIHNPYIYGDRGGIRLGFQQISSRAADPGLPTEVDGRPPTPIAVRMRDRMGVLHESLW